MTGLSKKFDVFVFYYEFTDFLNLVLSNVEWTIFAIFVILFNPLPLNPDF